MGSQLTSAQLSKSNRYFIANARDFFLTLHILLDLNQIMIELMLSSSSKDEAKT